jgi:uncharacterized protein (DUF305 family)
MTAFRISNWIFPALVATALVACGAPGARTQEPVPRPAEGSTSELEAMYWERLDAARSRFTEADVRFMTGMIAHHAQAVVVSRLASDRADSRGVRVLAARIINAQQDEIAIMQQWLRERGLPAPEAEAALESAMAHAGHSPDAHGTLTADQVRELESASGPAFDRLFLTYMIQHHRGAVRMVQELLDADGAGQDPAVFKFASDVHVDQTTEIARMERMLAELALRGRRP